MFRVLFTFKELLLNLLLADCVYKLFVDQHVLHMLICHLHDTVFLSAAGGTLIARHNPLNNTLTCDRLLTGYWVPECISLVHHKDSLGILVVDFIFYL